MPAITDLDPSTIIPLFEISEFNLKSPTETLHFCNYSGVSFEGQEYQAIPCIGEGYDLIGQGSIPNPTLTVYVDKVISNFLYQIKNTPGYRLEGSQVIRRITQKRFLDGQPDQNAAIKENAPDIFKLEQVAEETFQAVKFKLSTPFDLEEISLPSRIVLRTCGWWEYRGEECGYLGPAYDFQNNPTLDPDKDVCPRTLTGCEIRQGKNGTLTFGGFPGVGGFG